MIAIAIAMATNAVLIALAAAVAVPTKSTTTIQLSDGTAPTLRRQNMARSRMALLKLAHPPLVSVLQAEKMQAKTSR